MNFVSNPSSPRNLDKSESIDQNNVNECIKESQTIDDTFLHTLLTKNNIFDKSKLQKLLKIYTSVLQKYNKCFDKNDSLNNEKKNETIFKCLDKGFDKKEKETTYFKDLEDLKTFKNISPSRKMIMTQFHFQMISQQKKTVESILECINNKEKSREKKQTRINENVHELNENLDKNQSVFHIKIDTTKPGPSDLQFFKSRLLPKTVTPRNRKGGHFNKTNKHKKLKRRKTIRKKTRS